MTPRFTTLPKFDCRHRALLAVLGLWFVVALALRLNGWSVPYWHDLLDGSPQREVLAGHVRNIRSDDFLLDLGMTLAQIKARPQFPTVNPDFGSGEFMAAPINVPAGVFITLFRPFTWGFLIGPDVGLAWKWWGLTLGLLYSTFLVFLLISGNRFGLSLAASLALVVSPYFQFWSLHKAEIAIHWACAFVALAVLLAARRHWVIWISGAFLGWSFTALFLDHVYPPITVTLAWLLPFAAAAWIWEHRGELLVRESLSSRLGAGLLAGGLVAASFGFFWAKDHRYLELIRATSYPGQRFSTGGGGPWWAFFSQNFFAEAWDHGHEWLGNICEDASFLFLFPLIGIVWSMNGGWRPRRFEPWTAFLGIYILALGVYTFIGIPAWLARITLFGMATNNRTQIGFGLADMLIVVAVCARPGFRESLRPRWRGVALMLWLALLFAAGWEFRQHWPYLGWTGLAAGLAFQAVIGALILFADRATLAMWLLAAASGGYTLWFNPLVCGGLDYVIHCPLSNEIRAIDRTDGHAHRWVVIGEFELAHLPQMLGMHGIGGYNACPDFATWRIFDPTGSACSIYNQSAYAEFETAPPGRIRFVPQGAGQFVVKVDPLSPAFARANVKFFLVAGARDCETFRRSHAFQELYEYADKAIFTRKSTTASVVDRTGNARQIQRAAN